MFARRVVPAPTVCEIASRPSRSPKGMQMTMSKHPSLGRLVILAGVVLAAALAFPSAAQTKPQCADTLLAPATMPYPAPKWSEIVAGSNVPDYQNISNNFRVAQSLRLLISVLEKAIKEINSGKSLAGTPDVDGTCLCNCNKDAAQWVDFLQNTVTTESQQALQKTQDRYLTDVQAKIDKSQAVRC